VNTFLLPLIGGVLIGTSAAGLLLFAGQVAGISGIAAGFMRPGQTDRGWRGFFLAGLVVGGLVLAAAHPSAFGTGLHRSPVLLVAAGVLTGFGARMGGGCTSGHGVCGIGRLSTRSFVATAAFIVAGSLAVLLARALP
jgi:uncharacterized membrane protein YedE/YeeE